MMVNSYAIDLIKRFEGLRLTAYLDKVASPPVWTIGYGTTAAADVGITPANGLTITEAEAEWFLQKAVNNFSVQIERLVTRPINANEFGAMVSLAYNIGPAAFRKSSVLRLFNSGMKDGAAEAFLLWNKAGGKVVQGLVNRRKAERELFLKPVAALKPLTRPVDHVNVPMKTQAGFWAAVPAVLAAIFGKGK